MAVKVYFATLENSKETSPLNKISKLLHRCDIRSVFDKNELIALKVHFGELGNIAFLRPVYLRPVVEILKNMGTKPYLTDTNTLYVGMRTNSVDHMHNANMNGFGYSTLQVPVIIADGLRGEHSKPVSVGITGIDNVHLATDIINADGMVCFSHFKGHEIPGFGGAIKNLAMGCASRQGKLDMHSATRPVVKEELCTACGRCATACQAGAIEIKNKAVITEQCVGCARCIGVCPENAIKINWNKTSESTQKRMVEYAMGVVNAFQSKIIYVNALMAISPDCDCFPGNDHPVVEDIGYLASTDPVAIDAASYDLIKQTAGHDPFKKAHQGIDPAIQLQYANKIGFGSTDYELIKI